MIINAENQIEILEKKISEFQKRMSIKRIMLKEEQGSDNDEMVEIVLKEISVLKESIIHCQGELKKLYLRKGNLEINKKVKEIKLI